MPATPAWPPKSLPRLFVRLALSEGVSVQGPRPLAVPMAQARMAAASVPVSAGEMDVRIDVTGLYELSR